RVGIGDRARQLRLDQLARRRVGVCVAEPARTAGLGLDDDDRRRVPLERAVRLGLVGGYLVGADAQRVTNSSTLPLIDCLMISRRAGSPLRSALNSFVACSSRMCGGSGGTSGSVTASIRAGLFADSAS